MDINQQRGKNIFKIQLHCAQIPELLSYLCVPLYVQLVVVCLIIICISHVCSTVNLNSLKPHRTLSQQPSSSSLTSQMKIPEPSSLWTRFVYENLCQKLTMCFHSHLPQKPRYEYCCVHVQLNICIITIFGIQTSPSLHL